MGHGQNDVIHWRRNMAKIDLGSDIGVNQERSRGTSRQRPLKISCLGVNKTSQSVRFQEGIAWGVKRCRALVVACPDSCTITRFTEGKKGCRAYQREQGSGDSTGGVRYSIVVTPGRTYAPIYVSASQTAWNAFTTSCLAREA